MNKEFKMMEDHLQITVTNEDTVHLQTGKETSEEIGTFEQTTIQKIKPEGIETLKGFLSEQIQSRETQIEEIKKQLESLGEVTEIDQSVVEACRERIGKGTKIFKQKMLVLNNHLDQIQRKKALTAQLEYLSEPLPDAHKELDDLNKATA